MLKKIKFLRFCSVVDILGIFLTIIYLRNIFVQIAGIAASNEIVIHVIIGILLFYVLLIILIVCIYKLVDEEENSKRKD